MLLGLATSVIKKSPGKKVDKKKLLPAAKGEGEQKALPGTAKPSSIIVRPKVSVARKIKVTNYKVASADEGGIRGGALVYDGLVKRLDSLVKNTNTLSQIVSDQYSNEQSKNAADRKQAQKDAQNVKEAEAEAKAEKKQEKKSFGLGVKKLDLFGGIFDTLKKLFFAKAIMEFLNFFSDPTKTKPIFDFLEKNMTAIFISTIAALGVAVLAPLLGPGSILFGTLGLLGKGLIVMAGLLFTLIRNLITTPTGLAFLAFGAGAYLPMIFPGLVNEKERETYKKLIEDYNGDKKKMIADLEKQKANLNIFQKAQGIGAEIDEQIHFLKTGQSKQYGGAPAGAQGLNNQLPTVPGMPEYTPGSYLPQGNTPSQPASGFINPVPSTNLKTQKGGYARDTGLDIHGNIGDTIVSPVDGTLEYAEEGHTAQSNQDSDPTKPGFQPQHSFRIKLDTPFKFEGKTVRFVYGTHLNTLDPAVANKSGIRIRQGQKLGTMGQAGNPPVPHLHLGLVGDRRQSEYLDFRQVDKVLGGRFASAQASGISRSAPYEPGAEPPVAVIPQRPAPATPATAPTKMSSSILPGDNTASALNNYYRNQILGAMNRQ